MLSRMIDITQVQAFPIPPKIMELQTANAELKDQNGLFKNILIVGTVLLGLAIVVAIYNQTQTQNERDKYNR
jgi:hypothetical protein